MSFICQGWILLWLSLCLACWVDIPCCDAARHQNNQILVVGVTGTTGLRAVQGLLDVGYEPRDLHIMTRNANKPKLKELKRMGFGVVQADLEDLASLETCLVKSPRFMGCYIHATAGDTAELDKGEVQRAENLCVAIMAGKIPRVVYNSAAGAPDHGVGRIQQKHDVEQVFFEKVNSSSGGDMEFTSLRANLFMEELWKRFTRPSILDGKFPLSIPRRRKVYFTSVRDMGRLAGTLMREEPDNTNSLNIRNVAGDCLTCSEIAKAFANAQESPCRHYNNRRLAWKARWHFRELYEQIRFLRTSKETTDIAQLRKQFPGLITSFEEFLKETSWGDKTRSFEDFSDPTSLELLHSKMIGTSGF